MTHHCSYILPKDAHLINLLRINPLYGGLFVCNDCEVRYGQFHANLEWRNGAYRVKVLPLRWSPSLLAISTHREQHLRIGSRPDCSRNKERFEVSVRRSTTLLQANRHSKCLDKSRSAKQLMQKIRYNFSPCVENRSIIEA